MSTQHTPGPWEAPVIDDSPCGSVSYDIPEICRVIYTEKDAQLIAAAPELLDLLRAATAFVELYTGNGVREQPPEWAKDLDAETIASRGRATIAKATGSESKQ